MTSGGSVRRAATEFADVIVAGDSSGANLAAAAAIKARDAGVPLAAQLLVYPVLDSEETPFKRDFRDRYTPFVGQAAFGTSSYERIVRIWEEYVPDPELRRSPLAAPLRATDLHGVAPAVIVTAEHDILRGEALDYAAALERDGVPVDLLEFPARSTASCRCAASSPTRHAQWSWLPTPFDDCFFPNQSRHNDKGVTMHRDHRPSLRPALRRGAPVAIAAAALLAFAGCAQSGSGGGAPTQQPVSTDLGTEPVTLSVLVTTPDVPLYEALGDAFTEAHPERDRGGHEPGLRRTHHQHRADPLGHRGSGCGADRVVRQPRGRRVAHRPRPLRRGLRVGRVAAVAVPVDAGGRRRHPRIRRALRRRPGLRAHRRLLQHRARRADRHDGGTGVARRVRAAPRVGEGCGHPAHRRQWQGWRHGLPGPESADGLRGAAQPVQDWTYNVEGATIDTPATVQAAATLQEWAASEHLSPDVNAIDQSQAPGLFTAGGGLFFPSGNWQAPGLDQAGAGAFGFFLFPPLEDGDLHMSMTAASTLSIPAKAEHATAAAAFLDFIQTDEAARQATVDLGGVVPAGPADATVPSAAPGSVVQATVDAFGQLLESDGARRLHGERDRVDQRERDHPADAAAHRRADHAGGLREGSAG